MSHYTPDSVLIESHKIMLDYQKHNHGQAVPFRILMEKLNLNSTFSVHYRVKILEELGMVVATGRNKRHRYVAVKAYDKNTKTCILEDN